MLHRRRFSECKFTPIQRLLSLMFQLSFGQHYWINVKKSLESLVLPFQVRHSNLEILPNLSNTTRHTFPLHHAGRSTTWIPLITLKDDLTLGRNGHHQSSRNNIPSVIVDARFQAEMYRHALLAELVDKLETLSFSENLKEGRPIGSKY